MDKIILKDGTEIEIRRGAGLSGITTDVADYDALAELSSKLTVENLAEIKVVGPETVIVDDDGAESRNVIGIYTNMTTIEPKFRVTEKKDGGLAVTFGLRERTPEEMKQAYVAMAITYLSDEQAATVKELYPVWKDNSTYKTGDRVQYEDKLYKCLSDHTAQTEWTPDAAPSLWAEILTAPGEILPWKQPGSTNPYHKGDKVTHKGQTWESDIDNNVWEPGVVGTESLWHVVV